MLCTLTVDDHTVGSSGQLRYMLGGEPVLDRGRLSRWWTDERGPSRYVTSAARGRPPASTCSWPTCPPRMPARAARLFVEYLAEQLSGHGRRRPVSTPLFDPENDADPELTAMEVLVCVKRVPMVGGRIVLTERRAGRGHPDVGFAMSPHEECAVEEAIQITERTGGNVSVLTLGPPDAAEAAARRPPWAPTGRCCWRPTAGRGPDRHRRRDLAEARV